MSDTNDSVTANPVSNEAEDFVIAFDELSQDELTQSQDVFRDIVTRYYSDTAFKQQIDENPADRLREAGLAIPEGATVILHFNTDSMIHIVLPGPDQV
ncbi:MAG: hypothetical protein K0U36_05015 [Alphaproteobacteria bacterium]|nr:hypothetical protein [Alphaproteobacteria bacterium]